MAQMIRPAFSKLARAVGAALNKVFLSDTVHIVIPWEGDSRIIPFSIAIVSLGITLAARVPGKEMWRIKAVRCSIASGVYTIGTIYLADASNNYVILARAGATTEVTAVLGTPIDAEPGWALGVSADAYTSTGNVTLHIYAEVFPR